MQNTNKNSQNNTRNNTRNSQNNTQNNPVKNIGTVENNPAMEQQKNMIKEEVLRAGLSPGNKNINVM